MANSVMFLQSKLILPKNKIRNLIFGISATLILLIIIFESQNLCGIQHMVIINDLNKYEKSLEPEFCEILVEKIELFNEQCEPKIQILDCG